MPLDFPSDPIDGQIYDNYYWDEAQGVWNSLGNYDIPNLLANGIFTSSGSSIVPLTVKGAPSQAANLQEWKNNSGTTLASISASGGLALNNALTVPNGGTGATTLTSGAYLKGNGIGAIQSQTGIPAGDVTSGSLAVARGGTGVSTGAGLVPVIPTSVSVGSGTASVAADGTITFFNASNFSVDGAFTTTYRNYRVVMTRMIANSASYLLGRFRAGGSTLTATSYYTPAAYQLASGSGGVYSGFNGISWTEFAPITVENGWTSISWDVFQPAISDAHTTSLFSSTGYGSAIQNRNGAIMYNSQSAVDGFHLYSNLATNISGIIKIYGYN